MTQQQAQQIIINEFCLATMHYAAKRIARLNATDPNAAANDYFQAASAMDDDEMELFTKAIVKYTVEQQTS
jgi:hypothetical protein